MVTEIVERIAEYEPETHEGLDVSLRALRHVSPELFVEGYGTADGPTCLPVQ